MPPPLVYMSPSLPWVSLLIVGLAVDILLEIRIQFTNLDCHVM